MSDEHHGQIVFQRTTDCEELFAKLILLKVTRVQVHFDGSGDSGQIEYTAFTDADGNSVDVSGVQLDWDNTSSLFDKNTKSWKRVTELKPTSVEDIINDIFNQADSKAGVDWWNNDGGYGDMFIHLNTNPPTVTLDISQRVTTTEDFEFNLVGLFNKE